MKDLQQIFSEAVDLHQQKRLEEAEKRYLQVLQSVPENLNVLANLGIVCRDLGKLDEAEAYCRRTVTAAPDDPEQHLNLGAVLEARKDWQGAGAAYEKALSLTPHHPKILNNYGKLLYQQGDTAKGLAMIELAVRIEPNYPLALNNLGVIYSERGDLSRAGQCLERSVHLDPGNVDALFNLAGICNALNNFDKAKTILSRLITIDPHHPAANHMLAALSGSTTPAAPREYVEETFDKYAVRFDEHIQGTLGYTVPSALAGLVMNAVPQAVPFAAALDLGCGTGLSGAAFRAMTDRLVGIDVSAQMLDKAAAKKLYDHLEHEEIVPFLHRREERYNFFLAADVFIYLGDLQPLFHAIAENSKDNGIIACSIETTDQTEKYELLPSGRYAHNPKYLEQCAITAGFAVIDHTPHNIRREKGSWIPGELYLLKKIQDKPQTP